MKKVVGGHDTRAVGSEGLTGLPKKWNAIVGNGGVDGEQETVLPVPESQPNRRERVNYCFLHLAYL